MSLVTEAGKGRIPIAKHAKETIYYDAKTPKSDRVKSMTFENELKPIPYINIEANQRTASYISGISGSGKTTLAVELAKRILKLRATRNEDGTVEEIPIYIFKGNALALDPAYKKLPASQFIEVIPVTAPEFTSIGLTDLSRSICIFDDYENVFDKQLKRYVLTFIKNILESGRKELIDVIIINHQSQDYSNTKAIIFECDTFYLNVQANRASSRNFLKAYMGLTKKQIDTISIHEYESNFSWSVFRKSAPSYMIYDNVIKLL